MTVTDIIIILLALAGASYGLLRGVRPGLYLLIGLLCSVLAAMFLTLPVEGLLIRMAGLDPEAYRGAPAVAAFILEGEDVMAYTAALVPAFMTALILILFAVANRFAKRFLAEPGTGVMSRTSGFVVGLLDGAVISLLFAVVLLRLPRPLAGSMFRQSILINMLSGLVDHLLPTLAGGL